MNTVKRKPKSSTELWLNNVNSKNGTMAGGHKSAISKGRANAHDSFSLKSANPLYSSIPNNIHQIGSSDKPDYKTARGPSYKSQEEYYDEIIALKKQIADIQNENDSLKSKFRRLEEDAAKKNKHLGELMDPSKDGELRRTLADKNMASSAVVQSLKQKIFRLEQQIRSKEEENSKLSTDLKHTKVEEFRVQHEVLYNEIERLRENLSAAKSQPTFAPPPSPLPSARTRPPAAPSSVCRGDAVPVKVDSLQRNVRKLTEENAKLDQECRTLRLDMSRLMSQRVASGEAQQRNNNSNPDAELPGCYEDMDRKQLLQSISILENKLEDPNVEELIKCKTELVQLQLELDSQKKREGFRLKEIESFKKMAHMYKANEDKMRQQYEDKCKEVSDLEEAIILLKRDLDMKEGSSASAFSSPVAKARNGVAKRNSSSSSKKASGPNPEEIEAFRKNHAAKVIQRGWKDHSDNENVSFLQSVMKGYKSREENINRLQTADPMQG